jgi:RimJ/RimL family protein N-acetyltransferase
MRDTSLLIEMYADPAIVAELHASALQDVPDANTAIEVIAQMNRAARAGELAALTICLAEGDEPIGIAIVTALDGANDDAEFSFALLPAFRGRGLGSETAAIACDWASRTLGVEAIWAVSRGANRPSAGALGKAGFAETTRPWPDGLSAPPDAVVMARIE